MCYLNKVFLLGLALFLMAAKSDYYIQKRDEIAKLTDSKAAIARLQSLLQDPEMEESAIRWDFHSLLAIFKAEIGNHDDALQLADIGLMQKSISPFARYHYSWALGELYTLKGNLSQAQNFYEQAFLHAKAMGNDHLEIKATLKKAFIYSQRNMQEKVIQELNLVLQHEKSTDNKMKSLIYAESAGLYFDLGLYPEAIKFGHKAIGLTDESQYTPDRSAMLSNLGLYYAQAGDIKKALEFQLKALDVAKRTGIENLIGRRMLSVGEIHLDLKEHDKALEYLRDLPNLFDKAGNLIHRILSRMYQAECYLHKGKIQVVYPLLETTKAIIEKEFEPGLKKDHYLFQLLVLEEKYWEAQGNWPKALELARAQIELGKKIREEEKKKDIDKYRVQYDTTMKEKQNEILARESALRAAENKIIVILLSMLTLCSILFFMLKARSHKLKILLEQQETQAEKDAKNHAYDQIKKIVYPHQMQMVRDGFDLEWTMPIETREAVCISFDVQNSTAIGHSENHNFFENVLKLCHKQMIDHYDINSFEANAYMIKEMGDGFLCSVGFPFRSQGNHCDNAIILAHRFVEIFNQCVDDFLPGKVEYCAVGITIGDVTGYFPQVGLKQYDLYGNAIILATRYEGYRKVLLKNGIRQSNFIIIQNLVFEKLSVEYQKSFIETSIEEEKIRDDDAATRLYFKTIDPTKIFVKVS